MKKLILIFLCCLLSFKLQAQGKFFGGTGQGFASADHTISVVLLPIDLIDFQAKYVRPYIHIQWKSIFSASNEVIVLQKAGKDFVFESLTHKTPEKSLTNEVHYQFRDTHLFRDVNYYRLKMTDKEGISTFSKVIAVHPDKLVKNAFILFPNPAKNQIQLLSETEYPVEIEILNSHHIQLQKMIYNGGKIDVSQLSSGLYFMRIKAGRQNSFLKLVIE